MTETCLFCQGKIQDQGLGFYEHVEHHPSCNYQWRFWQQEIVHDHGGA